MSSKRMVAGVLACVLMVSSCDDHRLSAPKAAPVLHSEAGVPAARLMPARAEPRPAGGASKIFELLPEGTVGVVYIPRLKQLQQGIDNIVAATQGKSAFTVGMLLRRMGLEIDDFDPNRPAAIAMTKPSRPNGSPGATAILPVGDEKRVIAKLKTMSSKVAIDVVDGFAILTEKGAYKRAGMPSELGAPMPEGDLVIRVDVASLWKLYGEDAVSAIESNLEATGDVGGTDIAAKPMIETLQSVMEAATVCDLVFRVDGTNIELDTTVHFADGTKVPALDVFTTTDLAVLARAIPDEGMMSFALGVNPEKLWSAFEPIARASLDAYSEPAREVYDQAFDSIASAMKSLGNGMAMSGGVKDGRIELIGVVETKDPAAYLATMIAMVSTLPPEKSAVTITPAEERSVDGAKVTTVRLVFDPAKVPDAGGAARTAKARESGEAIFGKDGLTYNFVSFENRLLMAVGSDDALKAAIRAARTGPEETPGPLSKALAAAGPDTVGYLRMDFAALMREAATMASRANGATKPAKLPPPGEPIPFTAILNRRAGELRCRASVDIGKLAKLSKEFLGK